MLTVNFRVLWELLDRRREIYGYSWRGLAKNLGISSSVLFRLREGRQPSVDSFIICLKWLGITIEDLESESDKSLSGKMYKYLYEDEITGVRNFIPRSICEIWLREVEELELKLKEEK